MHYILHPSGIGLKFDLTIWVQSLYQRQVRSKPILPLDFILV